MSTRRTKPKSSPSAIEICSRSKTSVITLKHTWKISKFSKFCYDTVRDHPTIRSVSFPESYAANEDDDGNDDDDNEGNDDDDHSTQFFISIRPRGVNRENADFVSIFLHLGRKSAQTDELSVVCEISIIAQNEEKRNVNVSTFRYREETYGSGFAEFILRDELLAPDNGYLVNDSLTIYCEANITATRSLMNDFAKFDCRGSNGADQIDRNTGSAITEDLIALLDAGKCSDVRLISGDGMEFGAHRAILAARSPYFAAMFSHESVSENRDGVIRFGDEVTAEIIPPMLQYIYGVDGKSLVSRLEISVICGLLIVADMYMIEELKSLCEMALVDRAINEQSAADMLSLAQTYKASRLRQAALEFIKIQTHETLQAMLENSPDKLVNVFKNLKLGASGTDQKLRKKKK